MFFNLRPSRQVSPTESGSHPNNTPANNNSPTSPDPSPTDIRDTSQPSSNSPPRMSKDSEGYPSWLPKRPPPPAPASTMHSSVGAPEPEPDTDPELFQSIGGRKPTPRSVRIVSLHGVNPPGKGGGGRRDGSKPGRPTRVWSRGTAPPMPSSDDQGGFAYPYYTSTRIPQPKFNAKNLDLGKGVVTPSILARLYFYIFPILAFAHLPLQTYFDLNAVYIIIQVSKHPNPEAPGVPGSGKNWALAAAAYVACWLVWIACVVVLYELVYSFIRRWRVKRPLMMPIYLSSPAYTFVSLTSYTNFRFLLHLRLEAFFGDHGSIRDGLAETFYWYSQNLPTVALLMPRAGLCLALLLEFWSPQAGILSLADMGISRRDGTFFRRHDGTLTNYARGVLIANAAWTAWRILVLLVSWMGLWILSGQGCAGICGPRYRWEEEDMEKTRSSIYSTENESNREIDALAWVWKECTRLRIQDIYELCLNTPALRWGSSASPAPGWKQEKGKAVAEPDPIEVQRVLAAVGIPTVPAPARRRAITDDFFESPKEEKEIQLRHRESDKGIGPSTLRYPFNQRGSAQVSSQDKVPFPPSPKKTASRSATTHTSSESTSSSGSTESNSGSTEDDSEEEDEEEDDEFEEGSEEPSTGHASNSMSSLGHPISPSRRYPFNFRQPAGRGNSTSSRSHQSRPSQSGVSQSGISYSGISQSTGNRPSTDSPSDLMSSSSSRPRASLSQSSGGSAIPMPPRHPNPQRTRPPSFPLPALPSATAVEFPSIRIRADSGILPGVTTVGAELMQDDAESVTSSDFAIDEQQDEVGLLSPGASHTNLAVPSAGSGPGSASSRSRTGSSARSRANSNRSQRSIPAMRSRVSSLGVVVRSRAQSLLQSVSATSLDVVRGVAARSRTNSSMARLEEEAAHRLPELPSAAARGRDVSGSTQESQASYPYSFSNPQAWEDRGYISSSSHSRSGSGSGSGGENWTFGQPMPFMRPGNSHLREEVLSDSDRDVGSGRLGDMRRDSDIEEMTREFGPTRTAQSLMGPGMPGAIPMSASVETASSAMDVFHSVEPSTRTASPLPPLTPREGDTGAPGPSTSASPNIDIPWGRYRLGEPYAARGRGQQAHGRRPAGERSTSSSPSQATGTGQASTTTSQPDVSTAAQSFVTAAATIEGTTTESSGGRTEQGSLNEPSWGVAAASRRMRGAGVGNVGLGTGGMGPEREDSMGDWRVQ